MLASILPYLPVVLIAVIVNTADVYFLQSENTPPLQRSLSYWFYIFGHVLIALLAAFLLFEKANMPVEDWPIVTAISALSGFSLLQSLTVKFGDKGLDARDLFDAWKGRVVEDISRVNASLKRTKQLAVAQQLAERSKSKPHLLPSAVRGLAVSMQIDANELLESMQAGEDADLVMAQWITSADLQYAENLMQQGT